MSIKNRFDLWIYVIASLIVGVVVFLFSLARIRQGDVALAIFDFVVAVINFSIIVHILRTKQLRVASWIMSTCFLLGAAFIFYSKGADALLWAFPAVIAPFYLINYRAGLVLGLCFVFLLMVIAFVTTALNAIQFATFLAAITLILIFGFVTAYNQQTHWDRLEHLADHDPLTGLQNRRALDDCLATVHQKHVKDIGANVSIIMIDIDHFKKVNDKLGHAKGDQVLKALGAFLQQGNYKCFRYGGEEFVFVVELDEQAAYELAEQLQNELASVSLIENYPITASYGIAQLKLYERLPHWIYRADMALLRAKSSGRNTIVRSTDLEV